MIIYVGNIDSHLRRLHRWFKDAVEPRIRSLVGQAAVELSNEDRGANLR